MTDSVNVFPPFWRFLDANGDPVAGGYLEFYLAGSSTPLSVYSDAGLTTALGTTVYCDSGGHPVASSGSSTKVTIWTGTTDYKVVGKTSTGTTLGTLDNFPGALDTSTYATTTARPIGNVVAKASTTWSASTSDGSGTLYNANVAGGSQVVTLPSAVTAGNGYLLGIRHDGQGSSNTVTYQTVSSQAIKEGHASAPETAGTINAYGEARWLQSDGAGWTLYSYVPPLTRRGEALVVVTRLTAAPTSPAAGAVYLINGTPTGAWLAQGFADKDLVQASGIGTWTKLAVSDGMVVYVSAEAVNYQRQSGEWVAWANILAPSVSYMRRLSVEDVQAQNTAGGTTLTNTWHDRTLNTTIVNTLTTANGAATDAALATNVMTVPAGTYDVMFGAPIYGNYYTRTRLISATEADSATSFAVGTGSKAFTVASGLAFAAGQEVYIYSSGTPTRIMEGSVVSYSGTTLTVSVSRTSGSGTSTDWKIAIVLYGQNGGAGQTGVTNALHMAICHRSITLAAAHGFKLQSLTDTAVATFGLGSPGNRPGQAERYGFCEWLDLSSLIGPRGDQGPQGNDGADGGDGAAGAAGADGPAGATGAAAPAFIDYSLDPSSTADSDPGSGKLRPNNATAASVTTFFFDDLDRLGVDQTAELATWDDSTSTGVKGKLYIIDLTTPASRWTYDVTAFTAATGYSKITVTHRSGSASWPTGNVGLLFVPRGDKGSDGAGTGDMVAANNLSDVASSATAFANIKQAASETATGVVELATTSEVVTGSDTSRAVTPAGVAAAIAALVASSPSALNTLDELAAALGDDPNFATTVATSIGEKAAKSANLSDLASAATAFANIKQAASETATGVVELATTAEVVTGSDTSRVVTPAGVKAALDKQSEVIVIPVSDEATAITTGAAKVTFRMPFAMTLTAVRGSLTEASSSGTPTIDINEGGSTILSTKLTIDASEKTSTTAATAAVISDTGLADDAEITIDIDTAGTGAKGLKVSLIGYRT